MKLSQFLMGLNEHFTSIRGQILLMNPLTELSHAYAMILQEENQRESASHVSIIHENAAMNVKFGQGTSTGKNRFSGPRKEDKKILENSVICDYCKLAGHTRDKYFALHGYPDWHRLYGQPKPKVRSNHGTKKLVNISTSIENQSGAVSDVLTANKGTENLSETQCQQLITMLQAKLQSSSPATANLAPWINNASNQCAGIHKFYTNSVIFANHTQLSSSNHCWIIDSGATHHITPDLSLLDSSTAVNSEIYLPNGDIYVVSHIGTVQLTPYLCLQNVLVVPKFQCNLLSVPQLTKSLACQIAFVSTKCVLQVPAL
ncbi:uncharacterized protein LOC141660503 [Apium graveolens]|uniref:uncharacterized protein LOC141660503 n=1 Tax=Apium graveolens TaxID=4045 RepID=UPI003D7AC959